MIKKKKKKGRTELIHSQRALWIHDTFLLLQLWLIFCALQSAPPHWTHLPPFRWSWSVWRLLQSSLSLHQGLLEWNQMSVSHTKILNMKFSSIFCSFSSCMSIEWTHHGNIIILQYVIQGVFICLFVFKKSIRELYETNNRKYSRKENDEKVGI